ncbi:DUF6578 domain-containing protein [Agromyces sp. MMS24-JH15]|uniref:DUF6578 domain-containing protein n=1 Tax=Agromyces sp. MMS24-JH15 TaxID=3243765 RepID=UPI0037498C95
MTALVWMSEWEMACCGTPFAVGDHATWTIRLRSDLERGELARLAEVLGEELAAEVAYWETHHDEPDDTTYPIIGTVRRIRAVSLETASTDEEPVTFRTVAGSLVLTELEDIDHRSGVALDGGERELYLDGTPVPPPAPEDLIPVGSFAPEGGGFVAIVRPSTRARRIRGVHGYLIDLDVQA